MLGRLRRGLGDLPDRPVRARQLGKFYPLQIIADAGPGVGAGRFRDALEEEREHGERDVRCASGTRA